MVNIERRKKRKLKKGVKTALIILAFLLLIILFLKVVSYQFKKCDIEKGHICTVYDLRN